MNLYEAIAQEMADRLQPDIEPEIFVDRHLHPILSRKGDEWILSSIEPVISYMVINENGTIAAMGLGGAYSFDIADPDFNPQQMINRAKRSIIEFLQFNHPEILKNTLDKG